MKKNILTFFFILFLSSSVLAETEAPKKIVDEKMAKLNGFCRVEWFCMHTGMERCSEWLDKFYAEQLLKKLKKDGKASEPHLYCP
jgi:hypothetical protein